MFVVAEILFTTIWLSEWINRACRVTTEDVKMCIKRRYKGQMCINRLSSVIGLEPLTNYTVLLTNYGLKFSRLKCLVESIF